MISNRKKHTGFATVFALVSLTLVSVTIGGLMTRIAMQARRTNQEIRRAQLDQIRIARLLAGSESEIVVPPEAQLALK